MIKIEYSERGKNCLRWTLDLSSIQDENAYTKLFHTYSL